MVQHYALSAGTASINVGVSPYLGPDWYLRRGYDSPDSYGTEFYGPGEKQTLYSHPPAGGWVFCDYNEQNDTSPAGKNSLRYVQPKVDLSILRADVKVQSAQITATSAGSPSVAGNVGITNRGIALARAALHVHVGYDDQHSVTIGPPGQTTEIDADVADGTQVLLFRIEGGDQTSKLGAMVYNCSDFPIGSTSTYKYACRFQDFREEPQFLEYRVPHEGK